MGEHRQPAFASNRIMQKPIPLPAWEIEAREYDRRGNASIANGLANLARRQFRIADAIRRDGLRYG